MTNKKIQVPPLTAKMFCDLVLKWLEEPEHREWLEREYPLNKKEHDNGKNEN